MIGVTDYKLQCRQEIDDVFGSDIESERPREDPAQQDSHCNVALLLRSMTCSQESAGNVERVGMEIEESLSSIKEIEGKRGRTGTEEGEEEKRKSEKSVLEDLLRPFEEHWDTEEEENVVCNEGAGGAGAAESLGTSGRDGYILPLHSSWAAQKTKGQDKGHFEYERWNQVRKKGGGGDEEGGRGEGDSGFRENHPERVLLRRLSMPTSRGRRRGRGGGWMTKSRKGEGWGRQRGAIRVGSIRGTITPRGTGRED
eukprot:768166-Hanusia_phi.AAC.3